MEQIADAPYIREAEKYGTWHPQTEEEHRSEEYRETFVGELKKVRNLIQMAVAVLEGLPEDTVWENEITDLADTLSDLGFTVDNKATEIERW